MTHSRLAPDPSLTTGDRVGTLAVNTYRHMEIYYAVSGSGRVLHTLNPRLFPDTLVWIAQHASVCRHRRVI